MAQAAMVPIAGLVMHSCPTTPDYRAARERMLERCRAGIARDRAEWVRAVALMLKSPEDQFLSFEEMVRKVAVTGDLESYLPFLPSTDDQATAREMAVGQHPTMRYYASLACGWGGWSDRQKADMIALVTAQVRARTAPEELECFKKIVHHNDALAILLQQKWRKAHGVPTTEDEPLTPAEVLAQAMQRFKDSGVMPKRVGSMAPDVKVFPSQRAGLASGAKSVPQEAPRPSPFATVVLDDYDDYDDEEDDPFAGDPLEG